ncbi:MAG: hypothetical protein B6D64_11685 [Bacteroidetes bacterium 4484_276]|nr:MAG: hypothetical protein B6D64_11685 [Bacteroidetes bacterium 4484_276]RLD73354.1 MAG: hypothetical protein DRI87_04180 [Bacteroidota bacterium]
MKFPLVSVCMITYNHEEYIEQALERVLSQQTPFDVEVIVCDDYSTDSTLEKLEKYKGRITVISNKENLGPWRSLEKTFKAAKGKYIALLEGDDYWTDNRKLQQQVDFLEQHKEYAMCFTNYACVDEKGAVLNMPGFEYHQKREVFQQDLFNLACPPTRGVMFRKETLPEQFPEVHYETVSGDAFIFSFVLKDKPAYFMDEKMAVWRIRNDSLYSSVSDFERRLNIVCDFRKYLKYYEDEPQRSQIENTIKQQQKLVLKNLLLQPRWEKLKQYITMLKHD